MFCELADVVITTRDIVNAIQPVILKGRVYVKEFSIKMAEKLSSFVLVPQVREK